MTRKTNLFYTGGQDSNFITFSNYGESLTGNYLTTNTKMFPSYFLCLYIPQLYDSGNYEYNKKEFIKLLISYYENKLAVLRDDCVNQDSSQEELIRPLSYLLEAIMKYDSSAEIRYISNIIENDYQGLYCDQIFTIDDTNVYECSLIANTGSIQKSNEINSDILYGWTEDEINSLINEGIFDIDSTPTYDNEDKTYNFTAAYNSIKYSISEKEDLEFNVIIPLFNTLNIDDDTDIKNIFDEDSNTVYLNIDESTYTSYDVLVPYGIWFSGEKPITLSYDSENRIRTSWSLTLSSQFKPFPYSTVKVSGNNSSIDTAAYTTFALILKNYSLLAKQMNELTISITLLRNLMTNIQQALKNQGVDNSIQEDYLELKDTIAKLSDRISKLESEDPDTWHFVN